MTINKICKTYDIIFLFCLINVFVWKDNEENGDLTYVKIDQNSSL